jgi:hypothetical protein
MQARMMAGRGASPQHGNSTISEEMGQEMEAKRSSHFENRNTAASVKLINTFRMQR